MEITCKFYDVADMTVSTGLVAELCVLGLLSAFGGMLGLKMEGVLGR